MGCCYVYIYTGDGNDLEGEKLFKEFDFRLLATVSFGTAAFLLVLGKFGRRHLVCPVLELLFAVGFDGQQAFVFLFQLGQRLFPHLDFTSFKFQFYRYPEISLLNADSVMHTQKSFSEIEYILLISCCCCCSVLSMELCKSKILSIHHHSTS